MTDTKHTPTPLIADDGYIFDADHNIVGKTYDRRYAAHIVKCVNMHEELVEALKALHLQALQSSVNDKSNDYGCEALDLAYAALKKAGAL